MVQPVGPVGFGTTPCAVLWALERLFSPYGSGRRVCSWASVPLYAWAEALLRSVPAATLAEVLRISTAAARSDAEPQRAAREPEEWQAWPAYAADELGLHWPSDEPLPLPACGAASAEPAVSPLVLWRDRGGLLDFII